MKRKFLELISFFLFIGSILYIIGVAGAVDLYQITMGQAFIHICVGIVILGADVTLINYLWKDGEWS